MSNGYGRGYYGESQMAPRPAPRSGSPWRTVLVVAGLGVAVAWIAWPRKEPEPEPVEPTEPPPPTTTTVTVPLTLTVPLPALPAAEDPQTADLAARILAEEMELLARTKGFASAREYEDSVVASARQLRASGAVVTLAPQLAHLAPRLEP